MAILREGKLALQINPKSIDREDWIHYDIRFLWDQSSLFNEELLKKPWDKDLKSVPGGAAIEDWNEGSYCFGSRDHLISMLHGVLDTGRPDYWEPIEPGVVVSVYPGAEFPFMVKGGSVVWETGEVQREDSCVRPDDFTYTVIAMMDSYNLTNEKSYWHSGPSIVLLVTRDILLQFVNDLESEYLEMRKMSKDGI